MGFSLLDRSLDLVRIGDVCGYRKQIVRITSSHGLDDLRPSSQDGHAHAFGDHCPRHGSTDALSAASHQGMTSDAHLFPADWADAAFSRTKFASIWPLAERYCLGQLTSV